MELKLSSVGGKLLKAIKVDTLLKLNSEKSIFFAIHNRQQLIDVGYKNLFKDLKTVKSVYDEIRVQKVKIITQYESLTFQKRINTAIDNNSNKDGQSIRKAQSIGAQSISSGKLSQKKVSSQKGRRGSVRKKGSQKKRLLPVINLELVEAEKMDDDQAINEHDVQVDFEIPEEIMQEEVSLECINEELQKAHEFISALNANKNEEAGESNNFGALNQGDENAKKAIRIDKQRILIRSLKIKLAINHIESRFRMKSQFIRTFTIEDKEDDPYFTIQSDLFTSESLVESLEEVLEKCSQISDRYYVENSEIGAVVTQALEGNRPLRDFLPNLFKYRPIEDFMENSDLVVKYPLNLHFKLTVRNNLKQYPEEGMREYFGEKISLFFAFINMYRDWLVNILALGILHFALYLVVRVDEYLQFTGGEYKWVFDTTSIMFCVYISLYSSYLQAQWSAFELEFAAKYGQTDAEFSKEVRQNFHGTQKRDLVTDSINVEFENPNRQEAKNWALIGFLTAASVGTMFTSYFILALKRRAYKENWLGVSIHPEISIDQGLFDFAEFMKVMVYEAVFIRLVRKLVKWQDLKFVEEHESKIILISCLYQLFNNSCTMILVAANVIMSDIVQTTDRYGHQIYKAVNPRCIQENCSQELTYFFTTFVIFQFLWRLVYHLIFKMIVLKVTKKVTGVVYRGVKKSIKIGANAIRDKLKTKRPMKPNPKSPVRLNRSSTRSPSKFDKRTPGRTPGRTRKMTKKFTSKLDLSKSPELEALEPLFNFNVGFERIIEKVDDQIFKQNFEVNQAISAQYENPDKIYSSIDKEINDQVRKLEDYNINSELDPTIITYLKIMTTYSFNVMYGALFSLSYSFCWLIALIDLFILRQNLLYDTRRPICRGAKTIGIWVEIMKFISVLGICTNSFYMSLMLYSDKSTAIKLIVFVVGMIGMFFVKGLFEHFSEQGGIKLQTKLERVKFIEGRLFTKEQVGKFELENLKLKRNDVGFELADRNKNKGKYLFETIADIKEKRDKVKEEEAMNFNQKIGENNFKSFEFME